MNLLTAGHVVFAATLVASSLAAAADIGWPVYGADQGGTRYSAAAEITRQNVDDLRVQWTYRTGDVQRRAPALMKGVKFETTPILVDDTLVLCTAFSEEIALDPATGAERWRFDPQVPDDLRPANRFNCRAVAQWRDSTATAGAACATRILLGTADARLVAIDARTGTRSTGAASPSTHAGWSS